jgi:hypothetical protein
MQKMKFDLQEAEPAAYNGSEFTLQIGLKVLRSSQPAAFVFVKDRH